MGKHIMRHISDSRIGISMPVSSTNLIYALPGMSD